MRGRPFQRGADSRRNTRPPPPRSATSKTLRTLAREERDATLERLKQLRDQKEDPRVALEAARTLAAYSDGQPSEANVPPEEPAREQSAADAEAATLSLVPPPPPPEGV